MPKVTIDGQEYEIASGLTIIQACDQLGIEIPRFCYHPKLAVAGNCRMCLVEVEKFPPKPIPSCNQVLTEGMVVHTNSPMARNARAGVMEFLLINHPLDCPICDQGGECDLQDQAMRYGRDRGDYEEYKRAVPDKYIGPLIATHMTRCIHCTRCVRFLEDIAGSYELGAIGRGEHTEISTYLEHSITSELSGNIIDLCPVGALTSKPYAFKARNWELKKTYSIDVHDAMGCAIRIDSRDNEVMRILPQDNEDINECWISDKTRFAYDGLLYQRLDRPLIKKGEEFIQASWLEALTRIRKLKLSESPKIAAIAGKMVDVETMTVAKDLLDTLGSPRYDCRENNSFIGYKFTGAPSSKTNLTSRNLYLFNTTIARIQEATSCLLIGTNPRYEAAVLNARIRKAVTHNKMKVSLIGNSKTNLNYPFTYLGNNLQVLLDIAHNQHPYAEVLMQEEKPMIIVGDDALVNSEILKILEEIGKKTYRHNWNGFNILSKEASRVGGLDLGFIHPNGLKGALQDAEFIILLEADDFDLKLIPDDAFVIYLGHHGDSSIYRANIVLPSAAYPEKSGTYVNLEGRIQRSTKAIESLGQAKSSWQIILDIAKAFDLNLPYNDINGVRKRMSEINTVFLPENLGKIPSNLGQELNPTDKADKQSSLLTLLPNLKKPELLLFDITKERENFYLSNSIARSSRVMSECVRQT